MHESSLWITTQVYERLNERLGLRDHLMGLTVMLTKICTNLKVFGCAEDVIQDSLTLFSVSSVGIFQSLQAVLCVALLCFVLYTHTRHAPAFFLA